MNYELYLEALHILREIAAKNDFSPAGEAEFLSQLTEVKRLHALVCDEQENHTDRQEVC